MRAHPLDLELFPPAHQEETLGCSADLLLIRAWTPQGLPRVCRHLCAHVWRCSHFRLWSRQVPLGLFSASPGSLTGSFKLLEALLPSPRDCGVPASLCHFGLKSCPGQALRAGWGAHRLPHPQPQPGSDHCPAMPLISLNVPLQHPPPFLLACPPRPLPLPLISLSSGPTLPGSLPCCPRCQFLSLRGPRVQAGSVCLSLTVPVEYLG